MFQLQIKWDMKMFKIWKQVFQGAILAFAKDKSYMKLRYSYSLTVYNTLFESHTGLQNNCFSL